MITSNNNVQIKNIIQLQKKSNARKKSKSFVIEGIKMFEEVPKDMRVSTYISQTYYGSNYDETNHSLKVGSALLEDNDYEVVADNVFKEISETMTPQGVIGIVKQPYYDFDSIIVRDDVRLMFLEDIRDPGNLGTIVRTSEGAGIDGIVLSKESVDMFNPKVIRSTMGAIYRMPFIYEDNFKEALEKKYKSQNIELYAAHLEGARDYAKVSYARKCGLIIGNEANGISDEVTKLANNMIKIPMQGKVESLNAAISAALIMYEVDRQRRV